MLCKNGWLRKGGKESLKFICDVVSCIRAPKWAALIFRATAFTWKYRLRGSTRKLLRCNSSGYFVTTEKMKKLYHYCSSEWFSAGVSVLEMASCDNCVWRPCYSAFIYYAGGTCKTLLMAITMTTKKRVHPQLNAATDGVKGNNESKHRPRLNRCPKSDLSMLYVDKSGCWGQPKIRGDKVSQRPKRSSLLER